MAPRLNLQIPSLSVQRDTDCVKKDEHRFRLDLYLLTDKQARMRCDYCGVTCLRPMTSSELFNYANDERLVVTPIRI